MSTPHLGLAAIGGKGWMGGAHYVRNLAAAIHVADAAARITWICGSAVAEEWRDVEPRVELRKPGRFTRWWDRGPQDFRRSLEEAGVDFVYPLTYDNTYNLGLPFPLAPALGKCAWAGWIPDFQHRYLPELFTEKERRWRDDQMTLLAREAPRVVLSSRTALADFQQFLPEYAEKGTLLTFRAQPISAEDDSEQLEFMPERFFLVCNQWWKHKNHGVIFRALRLLRDRGLTPPVLCTGELSDYRGDEYAATIRKEIAELGSDQVQLLGLIPRPQQVALLRRALAVIQPSLFEGWSTVVEDTRVLGRPCLLSDLPVHREQNPPGAVFFDPHSPEQLAESMETAWREWPAGPDPHPREQRPRTRTRAAAGVR